MLITPPSPRLDYALPACCQARLLSCNHWKLRAEAAQTRQRCNQTINQQTVTLRPLSGHTDDQYVPKPGNVCWMQTDMRFGAFSFPLPSYLCSFTHLSGLLPSRWAASRSLLYLASSPLKVEQAPDSFSPAPLSLSVFQPLNSQTGLSNPVQ